MDVDAEIQRSKDYLNAWIDMRFGFAQKHSQYLDYRGRKPSKQFPLAPSSIPHEVYSIWSTRDQYERERGQHYIEGIRIHNDGTWTRQPTIGGGPQPDVVMWRRYREWFGVRYDVTEWTLRMPERFEPQRTH